MWLPLPQTFLVRKYGPSTDDGLFFTKQILFYINANIFKLALQFLELFEKFILKNHKINNKSKFFHKKTERKFAYVKAVC